MQKTFKYLSNIHISINIYMTSDTYPKPKNTIKLPLHQNNLIYIIKSFVLFRKLFTWFFCFIFWIDANITDSILRVQTINMEYIITSSTFHIKNLQRNQWKTRTTMHLFIIWICFSFITTFTCPICWILLISLCNVNCFFAEWIYINSCYTNWTCILDLCDNLK